jgi:hypothetical protein
MKTPCEQGVICSPEADHSARNHPRAVAVALDVDPLPDTQSGIGRRRAASVPG